MIDDSAELVVHTGDAGAYVIIHLAGDLDLESAPALTAELSKQLGARPVLLDLDRIEFMDSSGLGALVGAHKEAVASGGALLLAAPGPRVQRILKVTKLNEVFAVYETVDQAVASLVRPLATEGVPEADTR